MFFHFSVLLATLLFLAGLELIVWLPERVWFFIPLLLLAVLRSAKGLGKYFLSAIIPLAFALASVLLLYLIDTPNQKQVFIGLSAVGYYLALLGIYRVRYSIRDQTARALIGLSGIVALFFFYSATYGLYLNFAVPLWALMLTYCAGTFLVAFQYMGLLEEERSSRAWLYSLILGLSMAEIAWVINFWPFGYLTTGVIALIFQYILWDLAQSYFLNVLSRQRVIVHFVFFTLLLVMVLWSTRWLPVV